MGRHNPRGEQRAWPDVVLVMAGAVILFGAAALLGWHQDDARGQRESAGPPQCRDVRVLTASSFAPVLTRLGAEVGQGENCVRIAAAESDGRAAAAQVSNDEPTSGFRTTCPGRPRRPSAFSPLRARTARAPSSPRARSSWWRARSRRLGCDKRAAPGRRWPIWSRTTLPFASSSTTRRRPATGWWRPVRSRRPFGRTRAWTPRRWLSRRSSRRRGQWATRLLSPPGTGRWAWCPNTPGWRRPGRPATKERRCCPAGTTPRCSAFRCSSPPRPHSIRNGRRASTRSGRRSRGPAWPGPLTPPDCADRPARHRRRVRPATCQTSPASPCRSWPLTTLITCSPAGTPRIDG